MNDYKRKSNIKNNKNIRETKNREEQPSKLKRIRNQKIGIRNKKKKIHKNLSCLIKTKKELDLTYTHEVAESKCTSNQLQQSISCILALIPISFGLITMIH